MFSEEKMGGGAKHVVSIRMASGHRNAIKNIASRLYVRESELYRFAINSLIHRMSDFNDEICVGSELLPLIIGFRSELKGYLQISAKHLHKIINAGNADPDKFVEMSDIELLLLSNKSLLWILKRKAAAAEFKNADVDVWLSDYLTYKYKLTESVCCE